MDTHGLPPPPAFVSALPPDAPELVARVVEEVARGLDALMVGKPPEGEALLTLVAKRLQNGRTRVLHVSGAAETGRLHAGSPPGNSPSNLTLSGLLARLQPGENSPEHGIAALTTLELGCDRIVLVLDHADQLDRGAFRAIQLAAEVQPKLRLVLAGAPALLDMLDNPDLRSLHNRLHRVMDEEPAADMPIPGPTPGPATSPAAKPRAARASDRQPAGHGRTAYVAPAAPDAAGRSGLSKAALVAVLATVVLSVLVTHSTWNTPHHPETAVPLAAETPPASVQIASAPPPAPEAAQPLAAPKTIEAAKPPEAPKSQEAPKPPEPAKLPEVASLPDVAKLPDVAPAPADAAPPASTIPSQQAQPAGPAARPASPARVATNRRMLLGRRPAPIYAARPPDDGDRYPIAGVPGGGSPSGGNASAGNSAVGNLAAGTLAAGNPGDEESPWLQEHPDYLQQPRRHGRHYRQDGPSPYDGDTSAYSPGSYSPPSDSDVQQPPAGPDTAFYGGHY